MIIRIPDSRLREKLYKSSSLICDRCELELSFSADGLSKWKYDDDGGRILCPQCVADLRERAVDAAFAKINSFISGADWALSMFSYEINHMPEMIHVGAPPEIAFKVVMEKQKMIREAMENIGKQFGSD